MPRRRLVKTTMAREMWKGKRERKRREGWEVSAVDIYGCDLYINGWD